MWSVLLLKTPQARRRCAVWKIFCKSAGIRREWYTIEALSCAVENCFGASEKKKENWYEKSLSPKARCSRGKEKLPGRLRRIWARLPRNRSSGLKLNYFCFLYMSCFYIYFICINALLRWDTCSFLIYFNKITVLL